MKYELNLNTCALKTYYNIILEYAYLHMNAADDFLDYCYDVATLEADGSKTPAGKYANDNVYAQIIISSAEFLAEHVEEFDTYTDDDWNSLFIIVGE